MGFFDILLQPEETIARAHKHENLANGLKRYGLFFLLIGILAGLLIEFSELKSEFIFLGLPPIVSVPVLVLVGGLLVSLIANVLLLLSARLFGGKGEFGQQFGTSSLLLWPIMAILIAAIVVSILLFLLAQAIGTVGVLLFVLFLYGVIVFLILEAVYFSIVYLQQVHKLNFFQVVLVSVIYTVLFLFLDLLLAWAMGQPPEFRISTTAR